MEIIFIKYCRHVILLLLKKEVIKWTLVTLSCNWSTMIWGDKGRSEKQKEKAETKRRVKRRGWRKKRESKVIIGEL